MNDITAAKGGFGEKLVHLIGAGPWGHAGRLRDIRAPLRAAVNHGLQPFPAAPVAQTAQAVLLHHAFAERRQK